jgi:universal stress protein A
VSGVIGPWLPLRISATHSLSVFPRNTGPRVDSHVPTTAPIRQSNATPPPMIHLRLVTRCILSGNQANSMPPIHCPAFHVERQIRCINRNEGVAGLALWVSIATATTPNPDRRSPGGHPTMNVKSSKKRGKAAMEKGRSDAPILAQAVTPPLAMRRFLVPVDFSENSARAVAQATALAKQSGGSVILLHVVEINYAYADVAVFDQAALERDLLAGAEQRLEQMAQSSQAEGVSAKYMVRSGRSSRVIADVAAAEKTDLIVISTHGYTGLKHVLLGSTAENVVRYAPCPVLVLRSVEPKKPVKKA